MKSKTDMRGKHGKQGRKPTGRKRDKPFSGKFTEGEIKEIKIAARTMGVTQSDVVLAGIRLLATHNRRASDNDQVIC